MFLETKATNKLGDTAETVRWILGIRAFERGLPAKVSTDIQAVSCWSLSRSFLRKVFRAVDQRYGSLF